MGLVLHNVIAGVLYRFRHCEGVADPGAGFPEIEKRVRWDVISQGGSRPRRASSPPISSPDRGSFNLKMAASPGVQQRNQADKTNPDFSYRFLIGSGRAGSARHGGERAGAQLGQVVVGAMLPCRTGVTYRRRRFRVSAPRR